MENHCGEIKMANVSMELLQIGKQYTAKQLAQIWGYETHHALVKGVVTPQNTNTIVLFVTKIKQTGATSYVDNLEGSILSMMGQKEHGTDTRLVQNLNQTRDEIYLFYREIHHTPFIYYGRCYLIDAIIRTDVPSEFRFIIENEICDLKSEEDVIDYFINVPVSNEKMSDFLVDGAKKITKHVRYERNPYNRREAIRIQGHKCKICGFDFNEVYGKEIAENYIEVHHIKQLAEGEQVVDPAKDLLPVCANCHRMLHRRKDNNVSSEELKQVERVSAYSRLIEGFFRN